MAVSLDKLEAQAPGLVSLAKTANVSLQKRDLTGHTAKMALALDFSGSMRKLYQDGTVQRLAERVLALATRLDDDGAIDVFLFHSSAEYAGELTLDNYQNGVDRLVEGRRMGTTNYAAVMRLIREHYKSPTVRRGLFRKEAQAAEFPAYVMFITDGNPDSKTEATRQLVAASREGIFWQFMGVGREKFEYLHRLDSEVPGRLIDNANFFAANDAGALSDEQLFDLMLAEYPEWLPQARNRGLIH
ncbi:TerF-like vWA domain-containing protein [Motilibacter rhizosphaerae]|uniref:TerF-like vWA domain-containing protein n=1 Tax=Motilibacter rhizosphaerae TaxID=598652 RepID=A0A4Q7NNR7_9ACTN|nr:VWA domain-containing protein [Motilibacter rhizosphaerae]RZS86894.1 TerF-like vWA domain-containing protein [Motilibacter rhizosphaerae]